MDISSAIWTLKRQIQNLKSESERFGKPLQSFFPLAPSIKSLNELLQYLEQLEKNETKQQITDQVLMEGYYKWEAYQRWCATQEINPEIRRGDGGDYTNIFAYEHKFKPGDVLDVIRTPDGCLLNLKKIDPEELEPTLVFIVTSVMPNSINGFFKAL